MKAILVFCCLLAVALAEGDECYDSFVVFCDSKANDTQKCNAAYGGIADFVDLSSDLSKYANNHIAMSFDYLRLATNFGSFMKDRKGFEKLFRQLSDRAWEDGIDIIKYIAKRGKLIDFNKKESDKEPVDPANEYNEIESLARALDNHKKLATQAMDIHRKAAKDAPDPEVTSYLENNFLHKQADTIRSLAGHITDVKKMLSSYNQATLSLFIFDEYLESH